jgi:hypothetical protein
MSKRVTFAPKPTQAAPPNADAWVSGNSQSEPQQQATSQSETSVAPAEKMKRFTFDVPETLHRRVKARCAEKGVDMADEMRRMLLEHFGDGKIQ